jgi:N-acetylneuraminate lyase
MEAKTLKDKVRFTGVYPALCTPFKDDGSLNEKMLERLVEFHLKAGVDGLWLCGGTAEVALLRLEERKAIVRLVTRAVNGRAKIIAHVGTPATRDVLELARHAAGCDVDAIASMPPHFHRVDPWGIKEFYETIGKEISFPLIAYHVPGLTGVELKSDMVATMLEIPNLVGLKYSDYNLFEMANILSLEEGRLNILSGNDEVFLGALAMGAHGSVGFNHNYVPRAFVRLYQAFRSKNWAGALNEQKQINRIVRPLLKSGMMVAVMKHILKRKGFDCGLPRRPLRPLSDEEAHNLDREIDPIEILWED